MMLGRLSECQGAGAPPDTAAKEEEEGGGAAADSAAVSATAPVAQIASSADFWRVQVEAVYRRRNPMKLPGVEALMEKYKGKEVILYAKVCKTYDLDHKRLYADPGAWEPYEKDAEEEEGDQKGGPGPAACSSLAGGGVAVPDLFGLGSAPAPPTAQADCKTQ